MIIIFKQNCHTYCQKAPVMTQVNVTVLKGVLLFMTVSRINTAQNNIQIMFFNLKQLIFLATWGKQNQVVSTTWTYHPPFYVDMLNLLANRCLFTHPANTEQHKSFIRSCVLATWRAENDAAKEARVNQQDDITVKQH